MPAPVGQFDIEHSFAGNTWTNRYLTASLPADPDSVTLMDALVAAHRPILSSLALVTRVRHSSLADNDDDYIIKQYNLAGTYVIAGNSQLPLWCTARVDFNTTAGRPSRKYLRGAVAEVDIDNGVFTGVMIATRMPNYIAAILLLDAIVDPQGDTFLSGTLAPALQMRQLRRGTRRQATPVLG